MLVRRWVRPAHGGRSDPAGKFGAFLERPQSGQGQAARFDNIPNRVDKPQMGETTITMVEAAIANVVYDATGARLRQVPFTPARVWDALRAEVELEPSMNSSTAGGCSGLFRGEDAGPADVSPRLIDQRVESSDAGLVVHSLSRAACVMR